MSRRRQARELVLGCLYARESTDLSAKSIFADHSARMSYDADTLEYARRIYNNADKNAGRIDAIIKSGATHWDFGRIGVVEKNILRAAISELWFCPQTPAPVIIDEAVELAKDYAGEGSGRFVNGILDWVYKQGDEVKEPGPAAESGDVDESS